MRFFSTMLLATLLLFSACAVDTTLEAPQAFDCASIDASFEQKGDTCVSICVACEKDGGVCVDTDGNVYGDTCVTPAVIETPPCVPTKEICNNVDDDCDGQTDEGVSHTFYFDNDKDGYGNPNEKIQACKAMNGYVGNALDCNDSAYFANKHGKEICDGLDNDCNGITDDHCDDDGDGYCDTSMTYSDASPCTPGDCNDADASIHPGAEEVCGNATNDDCDGYLNEGCNK